MQCTEMCSAWKWHLMRPRLQTCLGIQVLLAACTSPTGSITAGQALCKPAVLQAIVGWTGCLQNYTDIAGRGVPQAQQKHNPYRHAAMQRLAATALFTPPVQRHIRQQPHRMGTSITPTPRICASCHPCTASVCLSYSQVRCGHLVPAMTMTRPTTWRCGCTPHAVRYCVMWSLSCHTTGDRGRLCPAGPAGLAAAVFQGG